MRQDMVVVARVLSRVFTVRLCVGRVCVVMMLSSIRVPFFVCGAVGASAALCRSAFFLIAGRHSGFIKDGYVLCHTVVPRAYYSAKHTPKEPEH